MIMVLLTTLLVPLIILTTFKHQYKNARVFYALILFMQAGLLVVFTALDGFLFYVGWEAALIPIYFICAMWGGENRIRSPLNFSFIHLQVRCSCCWVSFTCTCKPRQNCMICTIFIILTLTAHQQSWVFWAFFLAFAIKMPIFPFHTWQPDTYTEAPSAGTMMLSGIMLKMGIYGVIRWLIPNCPAWRSEMGNYGLDTYL